MPSVIVFEVISHEDGALMYILVALQNKRPQRVPRQQMCGLFDFRLASLQICEKYIFVVNKPPSQWILLIAQWWEQDKKLESWWPQVKDVLEPPETGRGKERGSPRTFGFWTSGLQAAREYISVVLGYKVCGNLWWMDGYSKKKQWEAGRTDVKGEPPCCKLDG